MTTQLNRRDLELTVRGVIVDALAETANATGLVAGLPAELLEATLFDKLFREHGQHVLELARAMIGEPKP